jgi:hypothetical protein
VKDGVMPKKISTMSNIKQLQKVLSKHIESGLCIKTDKEDWEIGIYENNDKINIPSSAIVFASNGFGDLLYLKDLNRKKMLDLVVYVYRHEEKLSKIFIENLDLLINPPPPKASEWGTIYYYGGEVEVKLGDEVSARDLLFRKIGRISYLPGVSKKHRDFEHDGMTWIGISFSTGSIAGAYIDPDNNWVKKSVRFLNRSSAPFHETGPNENLDE